MRPHTIAVDLMKLYAEKIVDFLDRPYENKNVKQISTVRYTAMLLMQRPFLNLRQVVVHIINFICTRAKNHGLFTVLIVENVAQHVELLYCIKV